MKESLTTVSTSIESIVVVSIEIIGVEVNQMKFSVGRVTGSTDNFLLA